MTRRVLLLAYMFPPIIDAGGFRPLAFARYLPEFGWKPIVLTRPDTGALPVDPSQLDTLPAVVRVERVAEGFAEAWTHHFRRRLAWTRPFEVLLRKPTGWIAEAVAWRAARRDPLERWEVSWMQPAIDLGLTLIDRYRPDAILASGPPFETLKAGWSLHERTGVPLVADFRDPWTYGVFWKASDPRARSETEWEARVVRDAAKTIVVTPSMQRTIAAKYPERSNRIELVMNGYEDLKTTAVASPPSDRFVLSYVGSIMERRFPAVLFEALRRWRSGNPAAAAATRVQFIGPNQCGFSLEDRLRDEGLSGLVEYLGPFGHDKCRELMRASHVLLHIETEADYAVSSKLFEYFSAGRPILGIVPAGSDDEWFLHQSNAGLNAGVRDPDAIRSAIHARWSDWKQGKAAPTVDPAWLGQFHRREQTRTLSAILNDAAATVRR